MHTGDLIAIEFTGKDTNTGKVFDTTRKEIAQKEGIFVEGRPYGPIVIVAGHHEVLPGLEKEIAQMKVGEEKHITLSPEHAFGPRTPDLVRVLPLSEFKKHNVPPVPGTVVNANDMMGRVQSVSGGRVRVDFNPELAGKEVEYTLKIVKHYTDEKEQLVALQEKAFPGQKVELQKNGKTIEMTVSIRQMNAVQQRVPGFAKLVLDTLQGTEKVIVHTVFEPKDFKGTHVHEDGTMHADDAH